MKRNTLSSCASVLAGLLVVALSGSARAEDAPAPAPAPQPPPPEAAAQASTSGAMTLPGATPAAAPAPAPAQAAPGNSEHDQMVGTLAIGFLGTRTMAVGCDPTTGLAGCAPGSAPGPSGQALPSGAQNLSTPVVGIRYWMSDVLGIDAGLGLLFAGQGGSTTAGTGAGSVNAALPSTFGLLLHGGMPLALKSSGHFTFEVIPEMNIGFSSWSVGNGANLSGSGFHFDLGARAGAEIHFGFIGIPQLSVLGTIGLLFATDSVSNENKTTGAKADSSLTSFGTTIQNSPWDIFTGNVAALYYFE